MSPPAVRQVSKNHTGAPGTGKSSHVRRPDVRLGCALYGRTSGPAQVSPDFRIRVLPRETPYRVLPDVQQFTFPHSSPDPCHTERRCDFLHDALPLDVSSMIENLNLISQGQQFQELNFHV
jgi:hypothetical protein